MNLPLIGSRRLPAVAHFAGRTPSLRLLTLLCIGMCFVQQLPAQTQEHPQAKSELPTQKTPDEIETGLFAGQGILVGEVTSQSAVMQVRLTKTKVLVNRDLQGVPGFVRFEWAPIDSPQATMSLQRQTARALAEHDFIARVVATNLQPGTRYQCRTWIGPTKESLKPGPSATFQTLPGKELSNRVRFVVVTGMNYAKFHGDDRIDRKQHLIENNTELPKPYDGPDKPLGYPALESILKRQPHFLVGTGDNVYYDTPDKPRAKSITELRQKWHEQFVQPRYRQLFASVPTYWMIDDHDYRIDDCDNTGDYLPTPSTGRRLMLEQLPLGRLEQDSTLTFRTHRVNRDLQIWFPENRMYRSPNLMADGPQKSIWGPQQKAWLMQTLKSSDAKFKLLVSPTPMVGPDDLRKTDNHTNRGGFRHEREEFFRFIKQNALDQQQGFGIVCGDRHWQYHAIDPTGIEEFSCGALVDANSRLGRKPGDPKSTDPEGLIKQPYYQTPRSGGFLEIEVSAAEQPASSKLVFRWFDERGKLLHQHTKTVPAQSS